MKKILFLIALALVAGFPLLFLWKSKPQNTEEYILGSVVAKRVSEKFEPVMVYRTADIKKIYLAGCGTIITSPNNRQYLLTAEHLFDKNFGTMQFLVRSLCPLQDYIPGDRGVMYVAYRGSEIVSSPYASAADVVMCEIGRPKQLQSFSEFSADVSVRDEKQFIMQPIRNEFVLRSLVSGRSYQVVMWSSNESGTKLCLIPYDSRPGESGTGFIDEDENLYILKGSLTDMRHDPALREVYRKFNISISVDPSMLIGPFNFKPRD